MNKKQLHELEEMVVDAWPAAETADLDGWLLRSSGGPSKRGNSVVSLQDGAELTLDERIARAEAWYQERQQRCVFQVGPAAAPKELDHALAARGYRKSDETVFCSAPPKDIIASALGPCSVRIAGQESDGFRDVIKTGRFGADYANLRGFLARLGTRALLATAYDEGGMPIAACIGISSEDRLGVYAMLVVPAARRKGAAQSLLRALALRARTEAVRDVYLLVEADNAAGRALYAQCGFRDVYAYHYRTPENQA